MTGIPNYRNPAFWKLGFQQLVAVATIAGAIIGRTPGTQIPVALSRVGSGRNINTQTASYLENSSPLFPKTTPTKHAASVYWDSGHSYLLKDSWLYYYECNR